LLNTTFVSKVLGVKILYRSKIEVIINSPTPYLVSGRNNLNSTIPKIFPSDKETLREVSLGFPSLI